MAALLALCAAVAYGVTDFTAGILSRRLSAGPVTAVLQALGLLVAGVGVIVLPGIGPRPSALEFGALSGVGSTVGSLALYHGMTKGRMAIAATLSAVLTAILPVVFGLLIGQPLTLVQAVGIVISMPAIALVCWQPGGDDGTEGGSGAAFGALSGVGFALLFVALDRAGTRSGAWPVLPGQAVALLIALPFAGIRPFGRRAPVPRTALLLLFTGIISAAANLLFLAATGHGALAIVSVLGAMYPAVTVLMARVFLGERTTRRQSAGLLIAAVAIVLVSVG